jgi:dTDP-4-amino-4,6-dideoxygalactose transaminase
VLFVNHEFGFAYENLVKLKRHGFVLIEDICHSFVSNNREGSVGQVGDFVVASFPKYFPVQCGGLLAYRPDRRVSEILDSATKRYCQSVLSHYQDQIEIIAQQKRANHEYLAGLFGERGMSARFVLKPNDVPGVFMFKVPAQTNLVAMKVFMARNGIQGGGFHKENAYFVPVHQNLSEYDMRYICEVATDYLSEKGDL